MCGQLKKAGPKGVDPDDLIQAALQDGLSEDKSDINSEPVHRKLAESTEKPYDRMMAVWYAYGAHTTESHPGKRTKLL
jgi:hypothetical protein